MSTMPITDLEELQRERMKALKQKLFASIALSIPLMIIGMFMMHEPGPTG